MQCRVFFWNIRDVETFFIALGIMGYRGLQMEAPMILRGEFMAKDLDSPPTNCASLFLPLLRAY